MAKAAFWAFPDAEARRRGERTGLDTPVVHAVNDVDSVWAVLTPSAPQLTRQVDRLGSTAARLKLKGIDGGPHKRWSMWFNSMLSEEPYQVLTCRKYRTERGGTRKVGSLHRWCMAVVSSCREVLG